MKKEMTYVISFYWNIVQIFTAQIAPKIGATTGTQLYSHCDEPLCCNGKIACKIRGPRSRAGFNAGPVAPPSEITKAITSSPNPIRSALEFNLSPVSATAPNTRTNVPRNSLMNPFKLLCSLSIVENVPKIDSALVVLL